jgi:hypothetical protein
MRQRQDKMRTLETKQRLVATACVLRSLSCFPTMSLAVSGRRVSLETTDKGREGWGEVGGVVAGSERRNSKTQTLLSVLVCFSLANLVFALLRLSLVRGIDRKLGRGGEQGCVVPSLECRERRNSKRRRDSREERPMI